jgi:hypothetical protein
MKMQKLTNDIPGNNNQIIPSLEGKNKHKHETEPYIKSLNRRRNTKNMRLNVSCDTKHI